MRFSPNYKRSLTLAALLTASLPAFATPHSLKLTWGANPAHENIDRYTVMFSHNGQPQRAIYEVAETDVVMTLQYLSAKPGDEVCFSIIPKRGNDQGPASDAACDTVPQTNPAAPSIKLGISQAQAPRIEFISD